MHNTSTQHWSTFTSVTIGNSGSMIRATWHTQIYADGNELGELAHASARYRRTKLANGNGTNPSRLVTMCELCIADADTIPASLQSITRSRHESKCQSVPPLSRGFSLAIVTYGSKTTKSARRMRKNLS